MAATSYLRDQIYHNSLNIILTLILKKIKILRLSIPRCKSKIDRWNITSGQMAKRRRLVGKSDPSHFVAGKYSLHLGGTTFARF